MYFKVWNLCCPGIVFEGELVFNECSFALLSHRCVRCCSIVFFAPAKKIKSDSLCEITSAQWKFRTS